MATQGLSVDVQEAVCRSVESISDEMICWLQDLVRIPSINPPGENYMIGAEFIGEKLRDFGYETHYIVAGGLPEHNPQHPRVNVLGHMPGKSRRPTLHFNGHFDVVTVG